MSTRSVAVKAVAAAILAVALSLVAADPAAADTELELSVDGATYLPQITTPLFSSLDRLVPLDSRSASVWVRNTSSDDAYLRVSMDGSRWSDADFGSMLTVQAAVPTATGAPVSVASTATCRVLIFGVHLDPSEIVELTITLRLGDLSGSSGQVADLDLTLGLTLTDAAGGATDGCSTSTTVPIVATSGRPPSTSATGDTAGSDEPEAAPAEPPAVVPPFAVIADLLSNTFAGFDAAFVAWAAAAVLAGALTYLGTGFVRSRRAPFDNPEAPDSISTPITKDKP
jgi:hypothetical protein